MRKIVIIAVVVSSLFAATGLAVAHDKVKNPFVKQRMDLMEAIGASTKTLGNMASGKTAFDADAASAAIGELTGSSTLIVDAYEPQEEDPVSEAKPEIWTSWDDFRNKAEGLSEATLLADVSSLEGLQSSMTNIGGACKACHAAYRE